MTAPRPPMSGERWEGRRAALVVGAYAVMKFQEEIRRLGLEDSVRVVLTDFTPPPRPDVFKIEALDLDVHATPFIEKGKRKWKPRPASWGKR